MRLNIKNRKVFKASCIKTVNKDSQTNGKFDQKTLLTKGKIHRQCSALARYNSYMHFPLFEKILALFSQCSQFPWEINFKANGMKHDSLSSPPCNRQYILNFEAMYCILCSLWLPNRHCQTCMQNGISCSSLSNRDVFFSFLFVPWLLTCILFAVPFHILTKVQYFPYNFQ